MKPTTFKIFSKLKIGILRKKICLCAKKMLTLGDRCLHIFVGSITYRTWRIFAKVFVFVLDIRNPTEN